MSVEAVCWALNLAPVPLDASGAPSDSCAFVLVGLANHAAPDGTSAFPSVKTLVRYTRKSERTVRTALARLEAEGLIRPCDPAIVAVHIRRADRRPRGWDLAMDRVRDDLDDTDLKALEPQFPGVTARVTAARTGETHPAVENSWDGVQPSHPAVENHSERGATTAPRCGKTPQRGATTAPRRPNGVQPLHERGAMVAPEPSYEPSKPPPVRARAREAAPSSDPAPGGGGDPREFFEALGEAWPLSRRQRRQLTTNVTAALRAGWTPVRLAEHVGANVAGVRNPYAVLRSRLNDLPDPPASPRQPAARPSWCGDCDERTRLRDHDDSVIRCPECHPLRETASRPETGHADKASAERK